MIHAHLADGGVFFGVVALALLLLMFVYAVITTDLEEATRAEAPLIPSSVATPPALPVRGSQTLTPPRSLVTSAGQAAPTMRRHMARRRP